MKAILTTAIIAVFMMAAFAMPMISAENNTDDSSDAIALYNDTSNLPDNIVIMPLPPASGENSEINQEAEDDMNESDGAGKIAWTNVKLWFTFGQEKKAQVELQLAKLQLIRAKIAANNNDSEAVEKALEAHERILERVKERISKMENSSRESNETKLVGLERAIQVHERRMNFLNNVLENANLTDAQIAKLETKLAKMENVTAQLRNLSELKTEHRAEMAKDIRADDNESGLEDENETED
jgi:hypothetical protein